MKIKPIRICSRPPRYLIRAHRHRHTLSHINIMCPTMCSQVLLLPPLTCPLLVLLILVLRHIILELYHLTIIMLACSRCLHPMEYINLPDYSKHLWHTNHRSVGHRRNWHTVPRCLDSTTSQDRSGIQVVLSSLGHNIP